MFGAYMIIIFRATSMNYFTTCMIREITFFILFYPRGYGNESCNRIGSWSGPDFSISAHSHSNAFVIIINNYKSDLRKREKMNKLFSGLGSVRIVKNCELEL